MKSEFGILLLLVLLILSCNKEEYSSGKWVRKGVFEGKGREYATSFTIGKKGYVLAGLHVLGWDSTFFNDLWEYDPVKDSWSQKADFPGLPRAKAIAFSINNKGYFGTGYSKEGILKDFWEYDPELDKWTQKADYGGGNVMGGISFSIADKGYVGLAYTSSTFISDIKDLQNELWEYNPEQNEWMKKSDCNIENSELNKYSRFNCFTYEGKCYVFSDAFHSMLFKYDSWNNNWEKMGAIEEQLFPGKVISVKNRVYHISPCSGVYEFIKNRWYYIGEAFDSCDHINVPSISTMTCFYVDDKVYFCNGKTVTYPYLNGVWEYIR